MPAIPGDVAAALVAPIKRWRFRYQRVTGSTVTTLTDVVSCKVQCNYLAQASNRTCDVVLGPETVFDQLTDLFRPWVDLLLPSGLYASWLLGTFRLSASSLRVATGPGDRPQSLTGYDTLIDVQEAKLLDRRVTNTGSEYVDAAMHVLDTVTPLTPENSSQIVLGTTLLPAPMEWSPGTSKLTVVNDLLAAINYESLQMDEYGGPVVKPYVAPDSQTPVWTYTVDRSSVILPGIDTELDLFSVPNVWLGYVSEPDRPTLRSVRRNDDPGSQTSTINRGREIVQVVDTSTLHLTEQTGPTGTLPAATQADLDALVERARSESSTIYEQVKMSTGLMPFHGIGDVVAVDYGAGVANYRETSWSMDLRAGGTMTHELRRAVTL